MADIYHAGMMCAGKSKIIITHYEVTTTSQRHDSLKTVHLHLVLAVGTILYDMYCAEPRIGGN